jgi:hypothetical protein
VTKEGAGGGGRGGSAIARRVEEGPLVVGTGGAGHDRHTECEQVTARGGSSMGEEDGPSRWVGCSGPA